MWTKSRPSSGLCRAHPSPLRKSLRNPGLADRDVVEARVVGLHQGFGADRFAGLAVAVDPALDPAVTLRQVGTDRAAGAAFRQRLPDPGLAATAVHDLGRPLTTERLLRIPVHLALDVTRDEPLSLRRVDDHRGEALGAPDQVP